MDFFYREAKDSSLDTNKSNFKKLVFFIEEFFINEFLFNRQTLSTYTGNKGVAAGVSAFGPTGNSLNYFGKFSQDPRKGMVLSVPKPHILEG